MASERLLLGGDAAKATAPAPTPAGPPPGLDLASVPARMAGLAGRLDTLAASPPQALVLEGGDADDRLFMALHWAARLNCGEPHPPCGACPACVQIAQKVHLDLILLDGREGAIKVDAVRDIRVKVLEPPRGSGTRVIVLAEAQELTVEAANALLKSMEEPRPGNCFVLLAPLRERLLPTLVSRSFVMSLPFTLDRNAESEAATDLDIPGWLDAFAGFVQTGSGWFERTAIKGRVPRLAAAAVLTAMEREVAGTFIAGPGTADGIFAAMDEAGLRRLDELLRESQEALTAMVNPSLVLDRLAVAVYNFTRGVYSE